jgi:hypothetical protein
MSDQASDYAAAFGDLYSHFNGLPDKINWMKSNMLAPSMFEYEYKLCSSLDRTSEEVYINYKRNETWQCMMYALHEAHKELLNVNHNVGLGSSHMDEMLATLREHHAQCVKIVDDIRATNKDMFLRSFSRDCPF